MQKWLLSNLMSFINDGHLKEALTDRANTKIDERKACPDALGFNDAFFAVMICSVQDQPFVSLVKFFLFFFFLISVLVQVFTYLIN